MGRLLALENRRLEAGLGNWEGRRRGASVGMVGRALGAYWGEGVEGDCLVRVLLLLLVGTEAGRACLGRRGLGFMVS